MPRKMMQKLASLDDLICGLPDLEATSPQDAIFACSTLPRDSPGPPMITTDLGTTRMGVNLEFLSSQSICRKLLALSAILVAAIEALANCWD
jgi:hypothetical protein